MALPSFVQRYLITLGQYSWMPFLTLVLGAGVGAFMASNQPPLSQSYRYSGVLSTVTPPGIFSETGAQIQEAGQALSPNILLAQNVIEFVAEKLEEDPQQVQRSSQVEIGTTAENSRQPPGTILVRYTNNKEEKAEEGVALLLEAMREQSRLVNSSRLRAQIEAIQVRLPAVEKELRDAEQNLEAYNRREEVNILAAQTGTLVGAITGSQEQQRQLKLSLEGVQAQINSLEQRLGLSVDQAYVSSALSADPIISNLRQQIYETESQLVLLQRDLRPEHPTIVELQNRWQTYQDLLEQRAREVVGGEGGAAPLPGATDLNVRQESNLDPTRQQLANTLVSLKTEQETLNRQLQAAIETERELRREYATIPNKQLEQTRLAQEVALKKALYDKIQAALLDAQAAEAETGSSLQIAQFSALDRVLREEPLSKILLLGGGAAGGLGTGAGLVLLLAFLTNKYMTSSELLAALLEEEAPVLGNLPILEQEWTSQPLGDGEEPLISLGDQALPLLLKPYPPYLESYDKVRNNLRRVGGSSSGSGAKVVVVTSVGRTEGKTTVACNLAIAAARSGKRAVVIEGDLRQPTIAQQLGLHLNGQELLAEHRNSLLSYYNTSMDCLHPVPAIANLYLVPCPSVHPHATSILESREYQNMIKDCRNRFDFVVIDSPSLGRSNDALVIESATDGIVMVVRPRYTGKADLKETLGLLAESQIPFLGAVVNGGFMVDVDEGVSIEEPISVS
ncbi:MAG: exopolysaccharide transport family protein [Prochlorotrichaceae cyanobacterium]